MCRLALTVEKRRLGDTLDWVPTHSREHSHTHTPIHTTDSLEVKINALYIVDSFFL